VRACDLSAALTEPNLKDLARAKATLVKEAPGMLEETDLDPALAARAKDLADRLAKETFFREIADIEQAATAIQAEYKRRYDVALDARVNTYVQALQDLAQTSGWERLDEAQHDEVSCLLRQCADREWNNQMIRNLRTETEVCSARLASAIQQVYRILEGERLATVSVNQYFSGGIENEEQLDQALSGVRDEFCKLLGAGKKVIVN
jgi:hypothetical protein